MVVTVGTGGGGWGDVEAEVDGRNGSDVGRL